MARDVVENFHRDETGQWVEVTHHPGSPQMPFVQEAWREHGDKLLEDVWPPTDEH